MMRLSIFAFLSAILFLTNCLFRESAPELSATESLNPRVVETAVSTSETSVATHPPTAEICPKLPEQPDFLNELAKDTWTYLRSDEATSNHLPHSWYSSELSGGDFANPAEMGLYALSWLIAYDRQASWSPCWEETKEEITAVLAQLRAWQTGTQEEQPHGPNAYQNKVFYQWYWVGWNPPVLSGNDGDHLVPAIDNAWLAASLITIREYGITHAHPSLVDGADQILDDMDFRLWYYPETYLFSWGGIEDPLDSSNPEGPFIADVYSNENRLINFIARAMNHLSREEFEQSLAVLDAPEGIYGDIVVEKVAFDGSYFTYSSPALFIREMETSYGKNTLNPATAAQIQYAFDNNYLGWGLSDSYDVDLGEYIQQGAKPTISDDPPEENLGVISAHVPTLALMTAYRADAISNLELMMNTYDCAYDDRFGFTDSVLARPDAMNPSKCSQRFSALAQLWIFLSLANDHNQFIWRYFYQDVGVQQAFSEMYLPHEAFLPMMQAAQ